MLSGHYVYTEVSNKRPGTVYDLVSEPYTHTGDMCVTFWYHMYGRNSGSLSLIRTDANQKNGVEVWKREGKKTAIIGSLQYFPCSERRWYTHINVFIVGLLNFMALFLLMTMSLCSSTDMKFWHYYIDSRACYQHSHNQILEWNSQSSIK